MSSLACGRAGFFVIRHCACFKKDASGMTSYWEGFLKGKTIWSKTIFSVLHFSVCITAGATFRRQKNE
jgi:hypothetical protein